MMHESWFQRMVRDYWWLRRGFLLSATGVIVLALLMLWGGHAMGVAMDCRPQQVDGQCGMAMAFGVLLGRAAALIVLMVGFPWAVMYWSSKA